MSHKSMYNAQIWRLFCRTIITIIVFLEISSLIGVPAALAHQPDYNLVFNETIYGSQQLQVEVNVYQWNESNQPWDRYMINLEVNTYPNQWFKWISFHIEFTQDGMVYEWEPFEGYYIGGLIDAVGEYNNDFWSNIICWPSQACDMKCLIEIPNDTGLDVKVTVIISYFNSLKEPIEYDLAATGWLNLPDLWPG